MLIRRTDAEAEALGIWPPDAKNRLIGKDPDVGKDGRQEDKRPSEDEMAGGHHEAMDMNFGKRREIVKDKEARSAAVHGVSMSRTRLGG